MLGNGIMLMCNGSGNNSEGSKHGGEGNGIGSHGAIGGVAELGGRCACCMCALVGAVERCIVCVACFLPNLPLGSLCWGVEPPPTDWHSSTLHGWGVKVPLAEDWDNWGLGGLGKKC